MVLRTTAMEEEDPKTCPRCMHELITIDGRLTKWLTCQNCRWKKLVGKENASTITVTPLCEHHADIR